MKHAIVEVEQTTFHDYSVKNSTDTHKLKLVVIEKYVFSLFQKCFEVLLTEEQDDVFVQTQA